MFKGLKDKIGQKSKTMIKLKHKTIISPQTQKMQGGQKKLTRLEKITLIFFNGTTQYHDGTNTPKQLGAWAKQTKNSRSTKGPAG